MNENNGWVTFTKRHSTGGYAKYNTRVCVVIGAGKSYNLYVPDKVLDLLGKPTHITIKTRGTNAALQNSRDKSGYTVQKTKKQKISTIAAVAFCKTYDLRAGVYDAHFEDGLVVFDMRQTPSVPNVR